MLESGGQVLEGELSQELKWWIDHGAKWSKSYSMNSSAGTGSRHQQDTDCTAYMLKTGCDWTRQWNCPGQPVGSEQETAADDGTDGFTCCCEFGLWRDSAGGSAKPPPPAPKPPPIPGIITGPPKISDFTGPVLSLPSPQPQQEPEPPKALGDALRDSTSLSPSVPTLREAPLAPLPSRHDDNIGHSMMSKPSPPPFDQEALTPEAATPLNSDMPLRANMLGPTAYG